MASKEQKIFDMSGRMPFHFSVSGSDRLPFHIYYYIHPRERFSSHPFPSNTRGVFYYYHRHDHPPVSGELRFRLCKSLEEFDEGHDLMLHDGPVPWNLSIYTLARDKKWEGLLNLLLDERLVDERLVQDMKNIRMQRPQGQYPWISMLDQPFIVDLAKPNLNIALLTRREFRLLRFQNIFWDPYQGLSPYTGTAFETLSFLPADNSLYQGRILARLEFSNHLRHMKRTSIVLRILDILSPIECIIRKYDGQVGPPVPGALYSTKSRHGIGYIAWAVPVDGGHGDGANKAPLPRFLDSLKEEGFKPPQPKFYVVRLSLFCIHGLFFDAYMYFRI